jgi:hypothetical protein
MGWILGPTVVPRNPRGRRDPVLAAQRRAAWPFINLLASRPRVLGLLPLLQEVVELPFSLVARVVPERRQEVRERARRAFALSRRRPPG